MLKHELVTLLKKDGTEIPNIWADVQPRMIYIDVETLPVEEGDHFKRTLPNGRVESYLVLEAAYWGRNGGWQIDVRKETAISRNPVGHQIHQYGSNARVNINSQDFSTNIVNESNVFEHLRSAIESGVTSASEQKEILQRLEALESAKGKKTYLIRYQEFIAVAANHMTVLAPFIPALTQMLTPK